TAAPMPFSLRRAWRPSCCRQSSACLDPCNRSMHPEAVPGPVSGGSTAVEVLEIRRRALMPIRIILAEDHVMVRQGLRVLLEQVGMVVIGEASDGQEALRLAKEHRPDVAILDIAMPHLNGIETARRLREALPQTKIILLTMHTEEPYVLEALQAG